MLRSFKNTPDLALVACLVLKSSSQMLPLQKYFLFSTPLLFCICFFKETILSYLNFLYSYHLSLLDGKIKQVLGFYWYASLLWSKEAKICVFLYLIMCNVSKD